MAKQNGSSNLLGWAVAILLLMVFAATIWVYRIPERADAVVAAVNQHHVDAIRALLREAGNADVEPTGPWDEHHEARFAGLVKSLQGQEHWGNPTGRARDPKTGWPHVADGIWSPSYSEYLGKAIAARPADPKSAAVREFKQAADALTEARVLWAPSRKEAIALALWSGFLSGWADYAVIQWRFRDSPSQARQARRDFARVIEFGRDYAPLATAALSLLGAAFSLLTVAGYAIFVRSGASASMVFKLAVGVELVEGIAYLVGQRHTLGYWSEGWLWELGGAAVAGIVVGGIEMREVRRRHPGRT